MTIDEKPSLHLIASLGGHLELLEWVAPALEPRFSLTWITSEGSKSEALIAHGQRVRVLPRLDRRSFTVGGATAISLLAARERPKRVVTTGAGIAVPFCITARALGARLVFVETMARVDSGSASGRMLAPLASRVVIQWPELQRVYPKATLCRPALLEGVTKVGGGQGVGTFVTLGSHDQPFARLLSAVKDAATLGVLPTPITVQSGHSSLSGTEIGTQVAYLSPSAFRECVESAQLVICHGGAGAIATVLRAGKRPLVMARRQSYAEHVDDHQVQLVTKLSHLGLVREIAETVTRDDVAATQTARTTEGLFGDHPGVGATLLEVLRG